jgi:hypothetical protein
MTANFNILKLHIKANKAKAISAGFLFPIILFSTLFALPLKTSAYDNYYTDASYGDGYNYDSNTGYYYYTGNAPRFNIFTPYSHGQQTNSDYYLLDIKNDTKGSSFNDPVYADPGDILTFSVFYHNGVINTVAHNTRLKVFIPSSTGTQIVSTAYLSADNAENAPQSNPLTETGTVNVSSSASLQYIYGSAHWYPNQRNSSYDSPTSFPFGQSGDEIIGNGININDIQGCWQYSGYINFQVRVNGYIYPIPAPIPTPPPLPVPPPAPVEVITGAGDITATGAEAAAASGITIVLLYFVVQYFPVFTKSRLLGYTYLSKLKSKIS